MDEALLNSATRFLEQNHLCLIRGAEGTGKTVLSRIVAKRLKDQKWMWASLISRSWRIHQRSLKGRDDGMEELQANADFLASFLFTRRWIPGAPDPQTDDPFRYVIENGWHIDLNPDLAAAEQIISKTVVSYALDEQDRHGF